MRAFLLALDDNGGRDGSLFLILIIYRGLIEYREII
jgi:hypothetical protein